MTKKEILEKLKKTYKRTTNRIFSEDCHIFNDHDFTCQLTLNFDKTLTVVKYLWPKDFCKYHLLTQLFTFYEAVHTGYRPEPYLP